MHAETVIAPQPPVMPYEFWDSPRFHTAFRTRDMGMILRLYRTSHEHHDAFGPAGITQEQIATWLGLGQAQISVLERGVKKPDSLSKMISWAETLHIPEELLWFDLTDTTRVPPGTATDDTPETESAQEQNPDPAEPPQSAAESLATEIRLRRTDVGLSQRDLARLSGYMRQYVSMAERPGNIPSSEIVRALDSTLEANGALIDLRAEAVAEQRDRRLRNQKPTHAGGAGLDVSSDKASWVDPDIELMHSRPMVGWPDLASGDDENAAIELMRRVSASDVGDETLTQIECAIDDFATAYPVTPPSALLPRLRNHLSYVSMLMDARMTLDERKRLVISGAWLSLLSATVHIDLNQANAATARLRTAASLAKHAGHDEIRAWCYETEAWRVLTEGDCHRAITLSRNAQAFAPAGSSIAIQSTAQEGRAWARLKQSREANDAISRVEKMVSPLQTPENPEHHYRYDPDKSVAYVATTLAWVGDPAAESFAREIIARLAPKEADGKWPRRIASANLDLALSLLVSDRLDEACHSALRAISSGRVVPSNYWRAAEVVKAVESRNLPEASDLREAFQTLVKGGISAQNDV